MAVVMSVRSPFKRDMPYQRYDEQRLPLAGDVRMTRVLRLRYRRICHGTVTAAVRTVSVVVTMGFRGPVGGVRKWTTSRRRSGVFADHDVFDEAVQPDDILGMIFPRPDQVEDQSLGISQVDVAGVSNGNVCPNGDGESRVVFSDGDGFDFARHLCILFGVGRWLPVLASRVLERWVPV